MSERKYKSRWSSIKLNALKYALKEALRESKEDTNEQEEIKALLKKTIENLK